jgi:hypothetical protein
MAEKAAETEAQNQRAFMNARERDAAFLRTRELERLNDLDRMDRLERERINNELRFIEGLNREEDRRRVMLETEKKLRLLAEIKRQRRLDEMEERDFRMFTDRIRVSWTVEITLSRVYRDLISFAAT